MKQSSRARALVSFLALGAVVAGCSSGSGSKAAAGPPSAPASPSRARVRVPSPTPSPTPTIPPPRAPRVLDHGRRASRAARRSRPRPLSVNGSTVVVMRADTYTTRLVLHAGYEDPGGDGWLAGPAISASRARDVLAAFNGGFRLNLGLGGFSVLGRGSGTIQPGARLGRHLCRRHLRHRRLGHTRSRSPASRSYSVRQNLGLLVDNGLPAADVDQYGPWGATLGGGFAVARSGLGIDRFGNLMWAGQYLRDARAPSRPALIQAGAVRAMQLDINPMWVGAFTFPSGTTQRAGAAGAVPTGSGPT